MKITRKQIQKLVSEAFASNAQETEIGVVDDQSDLGSDDFSVPVSRFSPEIEDILFEKSEDETETEKTREKNESRILTLEFLKRMI